MVDLDDQTRQWLARAGSLRQQGRFEGAIVAYRALLDRAPDLPESWYNLGWLQRQVGDHEGSLASYEQALRRGVSGPEEVHLNRAVLYADHLARPELAAEELHAALAIRPDYAPALLNLGNLHEDRGERDGAAEAYRRLLAIDPASADALSRLAGVTRQDGAGAMISRLRHTIAQSGRSLPDRALLGFALGRLLDLEGDYDAAFAAYREANLSARQGAAAYDPLAEEGRIAALLRRFPVAPEPSPADSVAPPPIFILGMFRSGSTLIEQILASHSRVTAGGELPYLPAIAAQITGTEPPAALSAAADRYRAQAEVAFPGHDLLTDKRPDNFLNIGLIAALFPKARIVHTLRNPLDTILSIYFLHLDPTMAYAFDLADIAHHIRQYRRLMEHWCGLFPERIIDVAYDALVRSLEPELRRLLDRLGLAYEPACLDFHQRGNAVRTASVWQVREPLHDRSSGRWRNYERHLAPILDLFPPS